MKHLTVSTQRFTCWEDIDHPFIHCWADLDNSGLTFGYGAAGCDPVFALHLEFRDVSWIAAILGWCSNVGWQRTLRRNARRIHRHQRKDTS